MPVRTFKNTNLSRLDEGSVARLQLQRVELPLRYDIEVSGKPIRNLFFLEEGIGSMTTRFVDGSEVETSMFGYESVIGVSALMGVKHSLNPVYMQLPGFGYRTSLELAHAEFQRQGTFQKLALRYVQAQLTVAIQNAACNAKHTHEQRLARWLLICADRAHKDDLQMAQEFVAQMLGSTRSTVSIAAGRLKAKGLINYHRGSISLVNKDGLEKEACECYGAVRDHLGSYADFDTGSVS